jgi:hypothetical protein
MALPGLLIEYLITGAIGIGWIIFWQELDVSKYGSLSIILIPVAYTLGMIVDVIAYAITYWPKQAIRRYAEKRHYRPNENQFNHRQRRKIETLIALKYDKLSGEINMRSSRDRIARGLIINALCILLFLNAKVLISVSALLLVASVASWCVFEYVSHRFYLHAFDQINEDLRVSPQTTH